MSKKKRNRLVLIILLVIVVGVGTFLIFKPAKKNKNDVDNKVEVEKPKPVKKVQIVDEESTSRPYAMMIGNCNDGRKVQSGLQDAYLVYEVIVEGGITRYMALFLDQDTSRIGPIRSSRHYFLDYALENDAYYVHCGQSTQAKNDFKKLPLNRIEIGGKNGWRENAKKLNVLGWNNLFTSINKVKDNKYRKDRKGNLLLKYSADEIDFSKYDDVKVANNVNIPYSNSSRTSYEYDSKNKVYLRSVNGKAHTDYVTKKQYTVKNIITYKVNNYLLDDPERKGRQGLDNIGKGEGYYISNGYAVPITWEKKSRTAKTIYKFKNGKNLVVNDGNTFIQIQPSNQNLEIS